MRPCVNPPLRVRSAEFGGPKPLFCVPLVAKDLDALLAQATVVRRLLPDVVEWRSDSFDGLSAANVAEVAQALRSVLPSEPIIFTLRSSLEGGTKEISQEARAACLRAVLQSGLIDLVDVELCNGGEFLEPIIKTAHEHGAHVILSFHNFKATPEKEVLAKKISEMASLGTDIAKIACMPQDPGDVLRLLQVTWEAREQFPAMPLCTMSMGGMGSMTRVTGFLYGSDMAFAVGQEVSAPGQIPLADARVITEALLRYA